MGSFVPGRSMSSFSGSNSPSRATVSSGHLGEEVGQRRGEIAFQRHARRAHRGVGGGQRIVQFQEPLAVRRRPDRCWGPAAASPSPGSSGRADNSAPPPAGPDNSAARRSAARPARASGRGSSAPSSRNRRRTRSGRTPRRRQAPPRSAQVMSQLPAAVWIVLVVPGTSSCRLQTIRNAASSELLYRSQAPRNWGS